MYITETFIPDEWKTEMIRYLSNTVNIDGGWGIHEAGDSTVFATVLYYIALRILGCGTDHTLTRNARSCIRSFGMFTFFLVMKKEFNNTCRRRKRNSAVG
jgi:lanosterol synthase